MYVHAESYIHIFIHAYVYKSKDFFSINTSSPTLVYF